MWLHDGEARTSLRVRSAGDASFTSISGDVTASTRFLGVVGPRLLYTADDELWATDGTAQGARRLAIFGVSPDGSNPLTISDAVIAGGRAYFAGYDDSLGAGLYVSDGTASGTMRLAPTVAVSAKPLGTLGTRVLFQGFDAAAGGNGLYLTDGTNAGTIRLASGNAFPAVDGEATVVETGGRAYFAFNGTTGTPRGNELWRTDGTVAGTTIVGDLQPGAIGSAPTDLTLFNGDLYFSAEVDEDADGVRERLLARANLSTNGLVQPAYNNGGAPVPLRGPIDVLGSRLYFGFQAFGGETRAAYITGPASLNSTVVGPVFDGVAQTPFVRMGGGDFFYGYTDQPFGYRDFQLYRVDSTSNAVTALGEPISVRYGDGPRDLRVLDGQVYSIVEEDSGSTALHRSDGTVGGTDVLKYLYTADFGDAIELDALTPERFSVFDDRLYFPAGEDRLDHGLYETNGTPATTNRFADLDRRPIDADLIGLTAMGDRIYFGKRGPLLTDPLYIYSSNPDGSDLTLLETEYFDGSQKTTRFFDFGPGARGFVVRENVYLTDGTAGGTQLRFRTYQDFVAANGAIYYVDESGSDRLLIRRAIDSGVETVLADLGPDFYNPETGEYAPSTLSDLAVLNGAIYFAASVAGGDVELWRSDGQTAAGTGLFKNLRVSGSSTPRDMTTLGNKLYFTAVGASGMRALWVSDGTSAGTVPVTGPLASVDVATIDFRRAVALGGQAYLPAGGQLYRTDGTAAGTTRLITTGAQTVDVADLAVWDNRVFVAARVSALGASAVTRALFVFTASSTTPITIDLTGPGPDSRPERLFSTTTGVYVVTGNSANYGSDLFITDGTLAGTRSVEPNDPQAQVIRAFESSAAGGGHVGLVEAADGTIVFIGTDGGLLYGRALWRLAPDVTPLRLRSMGFSRFNGEYGIYFGFNDSPGVGTFAVDDFSVVNRVTGQTLPGSALALEWIPYFSEYRLSFPGLPGGVLPNGRWQVSVTDNANVTDEAGNPLVQGRTDTFSFLAGDADDDDDVDFDDLLVLARNYGQSGRQASQGNFNYDADGRVDFDDLLMLARNFGTSLPPLTFLRPVATSTSTTPDTDASTRKRRPSSAGAIVA